MADKKVSELDAITGENTAADDLFLIVDTSGAVTKKITRAELNNAIEQDVLENISITNLTSDLSTNGNDINFGDNDKAIFNTDLSVYHTGGNAYIAETGAGGSLWIGADNNVFIANSAFTEYKAAFATNGAVTLYHDNNPKLATTATGCDVTGTMTADGLTLDGEISLISTGNEGIRFYDNSTSSSDLRYALTNNTTDNDSLNLFRYDESGTFSGRAIKIESNNDISFYADDGTTQGFYWDASTQRLGLGNTSPATTLDVTGTVTADDVYIATSLRHEGDTDTYLYFPSAGDTIGLVTGGTERLRITSGGNVGIGTTSPAGQLHISGTNPLVLFTDTGTGADSTISADSTAGALIMSADFNNEVANSHLRFDVDGSERMRIDSSGNVLVGKTAANSTVQGVELSPNGYGIFTPSGNHALLLNRLSSDGAIATFRKDGSDVGSVGTNGTRFYLAGSGRGLAVDESAFSVLPVNTTGANNDGGVGLGSSAARFSNLYLSGGVYLGGTGSSNYLDDYEEGTWEATAVSGSGSLTTSTSYNDLAYKKIGSVVHIFGYIYVSSASSPSGALSVTGLPFTAGTGGADFAQMAVNVWLNGLAGTVAHPVARISGSTIQIFDWTGTAVTNTVASAFSSGGEIYLNATYSV